MHDTPSTSRARPARRGSASPPTATSCCGPTAKWSARRLNVGTPSGLGADLSESSQGFNEQTPYLFEGSPEVLWASVPDWRLPTYFDLTPYLQPGRNVIALWVRSSQPRPRFVAEGVVRTSEGTEADLTTGVAPWRIGAFGGVHHRLRWYDLDYPALDWTDGKVLGPVDEATYSRLGPELFDRPPSGRWIGGLESPTGEVWLRRRWDLPRTYRRAHLRWTAQGEGALMVNGTLIARTSDGSPTRLRMYDVTRLIRPGPNTVAVRLARPLASSNIQADRYPSKLLLDGWAETDRGELAAVMQTDRTWSALAAPVTGWSVGRGPDLPASIQDVPDPQRFNKSYCGDGSQGNFPDAIGRRLAWAAAGIAGAVALAWLLGHFPGTAGPPGRGALTRGAALLLPGTCFLLAAALLKHRFAETEHGLYLYQPAAHALTALGFSAAILLTLLSIRGSRPAVGGMPRIAWWAIKGLLAAVLVLVMGAWLGLSRELYPPDAPSLPLVLFFAFPATAAVLQSLGRRIGPVLARAPWSWRVAGEAALLMAILAVGLALRLYRLTAIDLSFDENVSLDTAHGILRTGTPVLTAGIWYTRSPAFHYVLAGWLWAFGDLVVHARTLAVLWGMMTLLVAYGFTRQVTGRATAALVVTLLLALSPWTILFSRAVRFYQAVQCLAMAAFWLFFAGFVLRKGRAWQHGFFVVLALSVLHQELSILLFPGFALGFLFFYRPFRLRGDWPILVGAALAFGVAMYNVTFFSLKTLTPWVTLSTTTDSITKPHLEDVTLFFNSFFVGFDRMSVIPSLFFLLGCARAVVRRDSRMGFLGFSTFLFLAAVMVMVRQSGNRYVYMMYPMLFVVAVHEVIAVVGGVGRSFETRAGGIAPLTALTIGMTCALFAANADLPRILAAYDEALYKAHSDLLAFYREHRQRNDVLVSATPSPVANQVGVLDYYLLPASTSKFFAFDSVYMRDGRILDRWAGGEALSTTDQLQRILERHDRVWVHEDDGKFEALIARNPALAEFLQTLGQPVVEGCGTRLRLWTRECGQLPRVPDSGGD